MVLHSDLLRNSSTSLSAIATMDHMLAGQGIVCTDPTSVAALVTAGGPC